MGAKEMTAATDIARRVVESAPGVVILLDDSLTVVQASTRAIAMGFVSDRRITPKKVRSLAKRALESGRSEHLSFETVLAGSTVARQFSGRAQMLGRGLVIVWLDDDTNERDFEAVRRDFIANVTHEIKTPVGAISLLSEAVENAIDDPVRLRGFSESLRRETERLARLVNDVITLSRVESRDISESARPVNVGTVVREAIARTIVAAEAKNIVVELTRVDDAIVLGDGELLATAVKNLLENAIQYSDPNRTIRIKVKTGLRNVSVSIADQGFGIPPEEQERIFERFYRIDSSRDRATGGTGLGLSLVKHIVFTHRGDITLTSETGHGSTFVIRLPRFTESRRKARS